MSCSKTRAGLSEERLAQEVALLLVKADVREEIDRLKSHLAQARALFDAGGAQGRRLDFLAQELNREANTLCSKSSDIATDAHRPRAEGRRSISCASRCRTSNDARLKPAAD